MEVAKTATSYFGGCSLIGRSHQANRSASPVKRYLRWLLIFPYYCVSILQTICIALFASIRHCLNKKISIISSNPFACFLHARRCCVLRKHGETAQEPTPEQQGRAVEHSCGACRHHTPLRMPHTFRAANRSQGSFFFLRSRPMSCFTERTMLAVCLCHMVNDHSQRVCHPLSPTCLCLPRQGGRCMSERGRHGTVHYAHCAMPVVFDFFNINLWL